MAQTETNLVTGETTEVGLSPGQTEGYVGGEYVVRPAGANPMGTYVPGTGSTSMRIEGGASGRGGNITTVRRDQYGNIIEITERTPSGAIVFQRSAQPGGGYVEAGLPGGMQSKFIETETQYQNIPAIRQRADYFEAVQAQRRDYTPQVQTSTGLGARLDLPTFQPFVSPIERMGQQEEREYISRLSGPEAYLYYHPPSKEQERQIIEQTERYGKPLIRDQPKEATGAFGFAPTLEALDIEWGAKLQPLKDLSSRYAPQIEIFKYGATGGYRPEKVMAWDIGAGAYKGITEKPASFGFNVAIGAVVTKGLGGFGAIPGASRSLLPGTLAASKAGRVFTPVNIGAGALTGIYGVDVAGRIGGSPRPVEETGRIIGSEIIPFGIGAYAAPKITIANFKSAASYVKKEVAATDRAIALRINRMIEPPEYSLQGMLVNPKRKPLQKLQLMEKTEMREVVSPEVKEIEIVRADIALAKQKTWERRSMGTTDITPKGKVVSDIRKIKQFPVKKEGEVKIYTPEDLLGYVPSKIKTTETMAEYVARIEKAKTATMQKLPQITKTATKQSAELKSMPLMKSSAIPTTVALVVQRPEAIAKSKSIALMELKSVQIPISTAISTMKPLSMGVMLPLSKAVTKQKEKFVLIPVSTGMQTAVQKPFFDIPAITSTQQQKHIIDIPGLEIPPRTPPRTPPPEIPRIPRPRTPPPIVPLRFKPKDVFGETKGKQRKGFKFGKFPELANIATPKQIMKFKFKRPKI